MTITVNNTDIDKFQIDILDTVADLSTLPDKLTINLPERLLKFLKGITPTDTGETRNAWTVTSSPDGFNIVNSNGAIIEFLIKGVKPHLIEPKDESVLKIKLPGSIIFAKFVNHPGYSPKIDENIFYDGIIKIVDEELSLEIDDILKGLA